MMFLNPMSPNKCAGKIKDMQQTSQVDISGGPCQKNKQYDCRQMLEESQCQCEKNMNIEINFLNREALGLLQVS